MLDRTLLLSLRPQFAEKVLDGTKKVEFRRTRPRVETQDLVIVYASTPVRAIVGAFRVKQVLERSPAALWKEVRQHAGITRSEFDQYYFGAPKGYGILLHSAIRLQQPVKLWRLRQLWPGFHPPQCYRYLDVHETRLILPLKNRSFNL